MAEARARLIEHGEGAYADRFDEWWDLYDVRPIAAEITVWNHTVGYAGTLDLVARIGGEELRERGQADRSGQGEDKATGQGSRNTSTGLPQE